MSKIKQLINYGKNISRNLRREHIGAFAAQSSFFLLMSFFPLVFLIITALKISNNSTQKLAEIVCAVFPYVNREFIEKLFLGIAYKRVSFISISSFLAAWSAGKTFYSLSEAFRNILAVDTENNYFVLRFKSLVFSLIFVIMIAILFIVGVFGENIKNIITQYYPSYYENIYLIASIRKFFVIFSLFAIISLLYVFLPGYVVFPRTKTNIARHFASSGLASVVIYLYTVMFSCFADVYIKYNGIYGGISTFISVMLWLYGSMYIIILGFRFSVQYKSKQ